VHHLCREIPLEPLVEAEVAAYLAAESRGVAAPEGLAGLIYRHSDGNPLFMVAALADMCDRGLIALENGAWQIKLPLGNIHLEAPESLRQMIELQIEKLSAREQHVLEAASVTGISFTANANALGTNVNQENLENTCEQLSRRQHMVRRTGSR
jgi:predicted ATPase